MYNWKNDIIDIDELDDELRYELYYNCGEDDAINVFMIEKNTKLYDYLEKWYDYNSSAYIRSCVEYDDYITFATGCNYAIFDNDLLNGNGNGNAEKVFNAYIDYFESMNDVKKEFSKYNDIVLGTSAGALKDADIEKFNKVIEVYETELSTDKIGHSCEISVDGIYIVIEYETMFNTFTLTVERW